MRMPQDLEVLDLALYTSVHVGRRDLAPVDELECDLVASNRVGRDCVGCQRRIHSCPPVAPLFLTSGLHGDTHA